MALYLLRLLPHGKESLPMTTACDQVREIVFRELVPGIEDLMAEFSWVKLISVLEDIIKTAESVMGTGSGAEKKKCVIDIMLDVYDQYQIDIPYLPNMFEKPVLNALLGVIIDAIVMLLNKNEVFAHEPA
jgi:hypothetical protein